MKTMTTPFLFALALTSCGGTAPPPDPSCTPGSPSVMIVVAPADREFPECIEIPAQRERGADERAWCCWKDHEQAR